MKGLKVIIIIASLVLIASLLSQHTEGWFPTTTYVNTPLQRGVYPMIPNNWWGGNYYYRLNWRPWGYHRPGFYYRRGAFPILPTTPIPVNSIRFGGPMLTSFRSPKDYAIGEWVFAGTAYTKDTSDHTTLSVYQLNLDPARDLFKYIAKNKHGQTIPITLGSEFKSKLKDGDTITVQGMGDFIFSEADKYSYVYT